MLVQTLGLLALLVGVATVWLAITKSTHDKDPDAKFWYGFTGFFAMAPILLITVLMDRRFGVLAMFLVVAACLVAGNLANRNVAQQASAASASMLDAEYAALGTRQDSVLSAWSRYELDPAAAIDFPAMNDVTVPEVSALAAALAEAERLRREPRSPVSGHADACYIQAVGRLESAFRRAEHTLINPSEATGCVPLETNPARVPDYRRPARGAGNRAVDPSPGPALQ